MLVKSIITIATVVITIGLLAEACDHDQMHTGCRIVKAQCSCGYGCRSEYRYDNNEACRMALRGRRHDICTHQQPCHHDGTCLQISQQPGFKCRCEGTGYYGTQCEKLCPGPNNPRSRGPIPYECIII